MSFLVATYGYVETWTLRTTTLKLLIIWKAFQTKCYRKILKISWTEHRTNKSNREELKVEDRWLEIFITKQKLKDYGHLRSSVGFRKVILEGKIDGKRERGKLRRQWERYMIFSICL